MPSYATLTRHVNKYKSIMIRCPSCMEKMVFKEFCSNHVRDKHGVQPKMFCAFCLGEFRWNHGCKQSPETVEHQMACLTNFIEVNRVRRKPRACVPVAVPLSRCVVCKDFRPNPRDMHGRVMDRTTEYIDFYESLYERPDVWKGMQLFDEGKLNNDLVGIVNRFLQGDLNWYHLMVKQDVFDTFKTVMEPIQHQFTILPYWCICDGLTKERIVHRHMILACELESTFPDKWRDHVRYELANSGRSKNSVRIRDAMHLVNVIAYVSQRKASCDGRTIRDEVNRDRNKLSHYCINRPLSEHAIAFLSVLFEGGLEALLVQQNKWKDVWDWEVKQISDKYYNKRWGAPVKVTGFKFLNCTIPVCRNYEPTEEETQVYVHLMGDKKIFFKENLELLNLSEDDWNGHQTAKGNSFRVIADEMYVLGKTQQNTMNQLKLVQKKTTKEVNARWENKYSTMERRYGELERRCGEWERRYGELERRYGELERRYGELERRCGELERCCGEWERRCGEWERRCGEWERRCGELEKRNAELERENSELKKRNAELEGRNAELERENSELKKRNAELEGRNSVLERENSELKKRNAELEGRNSELKKRNAELEKRYLADLEKRYSDLEKRYIDLEERYNAVLAEIQRLKVDHAAEI